jgi:hypothetical protein
MAMLAIGTGLAQAQTTQQRQSFFALQAADSTADSLKADPGAIIVTGSEIEKLPFRDIKRTLGLQNSVVLQDGNLYLRGGRVGESAYFIDGAYAASLLTNTPSLYIIPEAVAMLTIHTGGGSAEMGHYLGGAVSTRLKTGGEQFTSAFDYRTDDFADEGEKFLGTYSYQHQSAVFTMGGPLLNDRVRFFVAGEYRKKGDRQVRFSKGFDLVELNGGPLVSLDFPYDTVFAYQYPDGFTPGQSEEIWAAQGTAQYDAQPLQLRFSASFSDQTQQFNTGISPLAPMLNVRNNRYFEEVNRDLLLTANASWQFNSRSTGEIFYHYLSHKFDTEDSYFGNEWIKWYDSLEVARVIGDAVRYASRYRPPSYYIFNGWPFARDGEPQSTYRTQSEHYHNIGLRFSTRFNERHTLTVGGNYRAHTLRQFSIQPGAMSLLEQQGVSDIRAIDPSRWGFTSQVDNFGYDIYGQSADEDVYRDGAQIAEAPKTPAFASLYLQHQMRTDRATLNIGLRYDYMDTEGKRLRSPDSLFFNPQTWQFEETAFEPLGAFHRLSPRLGIVAKLNQNATIFANFAHLVQMVPLETIYAGNVRFSREMVNIIFFNPKPVALGLKPAQSNVFEFGVFNKFSPNVAVKAVGFYRKTDDQVTMVRKTPVNVSPYPSLENGDISETSGADFSLSMQNGRGLQAQVNYTFSRGRGTGSNRYFHAYVASRDREKQDYLHPLEYQQQHRGSVLLDYRGGTDEAGSVIGVFGISAVYSFNSGHPYTFSKLARSGSASVYDANVGYLKDPRALEFLEPIGSSTTPFVHTLDLRFDKSLNLMKQLKATFYVQINNLFNTKNVINVYPATGVADNDGFYLNESDSFRNSLLETYGEAWLRMHKAINIDNGQAYWSTTGKEFYGNPRQIFFGLKLSY